MSVEAFKREKKVRWDPVKEQIVYEQNPLAKPRRQRP